VKATYKSYFIYLFYYSVGLCSFQIDWCGVNSGNVGRYHGTTEQPRCHSRLMYQCRIQFTVLFGYRNTCTEFLPVLIKPQITFLSFS